MANNFKDNLKQFILDNGVIGTTAGVCIAIVTKELIQSFVADILIPTIIIILSFLKLKMLVNILPKKDKSGINFILFINQLISWIFVVIITFIFISYSMKYLLGIDKHIKKNDK